MATLADYRVLQDLPFTLNANEEKTISTMEIGNLATSHNMTRAILSFMVKPTSPSVKFDIDVNSNTVFNNFEVNQQGNSRLCHMEVFSPSVLHENATNQVQFRVESEEAQFSDIVLWFQQVIK